MDKQEKKIKIMKRSNLPLIIFLCFSLFIGASAAVYMKMERNDSTIVFVNSDSSSDSQYENKSDNSNDNNSHKTTTSKKQKTVKTTVTTSATATKQATVFPIEVNAVTYEQLLEINGIGEVTANNIIEYRISVGIIYNINMLLNVNGIGQKKLENLKNYLYVSDENYRDLTSSETTITTTTITKHTQIPTTTATTISHKITSKTTVTTQIPQRKNVNINLAAPEEISECLLIDLDIAKRIVEFRVKIIAYEDKLELLYIEGITNNLYNQIRDYVSV